MVCSTPHALSPDALSLRTLSPRALSPRALSTDGLSVVVNSSGASPASFINDFINAVFDRLPLKNYHL